LERAGAESALSNNQTLMSDVLKRAGAAPDNASSARILTGSGIPGMGEKGLDILTSQREKAADRDYEQNSPMGQARLKLLQAQANASARGDQPEIVRTLRSVGIDPNSEQGRAIIMRSLKGGDPVSEALQGVIMGALKRQNGQPATGGVQPQSNAGGTVPQTGVIPVADGDQGGVIPVQSATAQPAKPSRGGLFPDMDPETKRTIAQAMLANKATEALGKALLEEANADKLGKEAGNENDKRQLNTTELLSRLNIMEKSFKPEFQTIDEQVKQYGLSWIDAIGPLRSKLPPETQQRMAEFTVHRQNTLMNLNNYIKEITGSAMGIEEAKRIITAMPNTDDGPTQFQAKLKNVTDTAKLAVARYNYLRKNGFTGDASQAEVVMPLGRVKSAIDGRATQLYQQLKSANPSAPEGEIRKGVRDALRADFGIDA
jgi:hypothetical protein